jgi:hypothetical protein
MFIRGNYGIFSSLLIILQIFFPMIIEDGYMIKVTVISVEF